MIDDATTPVKATATSARVINALLNLDGATITDLDEHLELSKSSIHDHLETLARLGLIVREDWTYRASLRFLRIGSTARDRHPFYQAGLSEVRQLATMSGLVASLVVIEQDEAICLHTATGKQAEKSHIEMGDTLPLHCTAAGKALLAAMSPAALDAIIETHGQMEYTTNTVTDRESLDEELRTVRSRGLAFEREEWHTDHRGIAASIDDTDGGPIGAICVTSTTDLLSGKSFQQDVPGLVISSANTIRKTLHSE